MDGRFKFWGGIVATVLGKYQGMSQNRWTDRTAGGGKDLFEWHKCFATRLGVKIYWETPATSVIQDQDSGAVLGLTVSRNGRNRKISARGGVVLACGGFEASPALRTKYLGPGWDLAHVRGTRYNTGDGHRMASQVGARMVGNY